MLKGPNFRGGKGGISVGGWSEFDVVVVFDDSGGGDCDCGAELGVLDIAKRVMVV